MSALWVNLLLTGGAYVLQFHVLPQWGLTTATPDVLLAACAVGSMFFGSAMTLPFAFLFGIAADLVLGCGYGMYLLPLVLCAHLGQYLSSVAFERPYLAALLVGAGAIAARWFRILFVWGAGHGAAPGGNDLVWSAAAGLLTALCALALILWMDHRQREGKSGRYDG